MPAIEESRGAALLKAVSELKPARTHGNLRSIVSLLTHRSVLVRIAAVECLARANAGHSELRAALSTEKNDLVLSAICEVLEEAGDRKSVKPLKALAENHRSTVARTSALEGIYSLEGARAMPFLRRRLTAEKSPRVRATLEVLLWCLGAVPSLERVKAALRSRDYIVRCSIANLLERLTPRQKRQEVIAVLEASLEAEPTVAARSSLESAIRSLGR
ncbi:MAG: HEAT repeat domain-containing protein [Acidobacteriota bacterium]